jgi:hypothetical protein
MDGELDDINTTLGSITFGSLVDIPWEPREEAEVDLEVFDCIVPEWVPVEFREIKVARGGERIKVGEEEFCIFEYPDSLEGVERLGRALEKKRDRNLMFLIEKESASRKFQRRNASLLREGPRGGEGLSVCPWEYLVGQIRILSVRLMCTVVEVEKDTLEEVLICLIKVAKKKSPVYYGLSLKKCSDSRELLSEVARHVGGIRKKEVESIEKEFSSLGDALKKICTNGFLQAVPGVRRETLEKFSVLLTRL